MTGKAEREAITEKTCHKLYVSIGLTGNDLFRRRSLYHVLGLVVRWGILGSAKSSSTELYPFRGYAGE